MLNIRYLLYLYGTLSKLGFTLYALLLDLYTLSQRQISYIIVLSPIGKIDHYWLNRQKKVQVLKKEKSSSLSVEIRPRCSHGSAVTGFVAIVADC